MTLYSADISALATPVEKKKKGKKATPLTPESTPEPKEVANDPPPAPKKQRTEKQIAAFEKAKETRKRKREEQEAAEQAKQKEIEAKEKEIYEKEAALAEKKRLRAEARKQKKEQVKPIDPATPTPVKKPGKKKDDSEPPAWFAKYVEGVRHEEARITNEKKPKKEIKEEAKQKAAESWNDGLTRDRVADEVDSHMNRMYSMIFTNRRMK